VELKREVCDGTGSRQLVQERGRRGVAAAHLRNRIPGEGTARSRLATAALRRSPLRTRAHARACAHKHGQCGVAAAHLRNRIPGEGGQSRPIAAAIALHSLPPPPRPALAPRTPAHPHPFLSTRPHTHNSIASRLHSTGVCRCGARKKLSDGSSHLSPPTYPAARHSPAPTSAPPHPTGIR
jgi:hypothetical protein